MKIYKFKNYLFYISFFMLFSILISAGYYYSRIQFNDGLRINLAGRQRMLSQKITKEILLYKIDEISSDHIENSLKVFAETQNALINGGPASLDLESLNFKVLPEISDKMSIEKLLEVKGEWESIEKNIIVNIKTKDKESLKYIIDHNEILLTKIDNSVFALQLNSEKNSMIIRIIIIFSFIMISALLVISFLEKMKELRSASERITELETLLPICSSCKKIRVDNAKPLDPRSWTTIEEYLHVNKEMLFTHSICPDCVRKLYPGMLEEMEE